jgi:hypothetical protein
VGPPKVLYHVSDQAGIARFDPRPTPSSTIDATAEVVWAIDEVHLPNYLLPRDCPRVTFGAGVMTTAADVERWLVSAARVVAIERDWVDRLRRARLYCYHLPTQSFRLLDVHAGYYVSSEPVTPVSVRHIDDVVLALLAHDVEVRLVPSLWSLRDAVVASSLEFSLIRMRNAQPRTSPGGVE